MALGNDNYHGCIPWPMATLKVTWLECAAASLCWSTISVHYLEETYSHLMLEEMSRGELANHSIYNYQLRSALGRHR